MPRPLAVIMVYAPTDVAGPTDKQAFWEALDGLVRTVPSRFAILRLGHVARMPDESVVKHFSAQRGVQVPKCPVVGLGQRGLVLY